MRTAVIAAIVAAVIAAATATAGTLQVITGAQIKNGSIGLKDLSASAKRALKGNRGPAGARGPQGPAGPAGAAGAQGPPGLQSLQTVTNTVSVAPNATGDVTATCPSGRAAVSGGFSFAGIIGASASTGPGWRAIGFNDLASAQNLTAIAYCAPNVSFTSAALARAAADDALDSAGSR